MSFDHVGKYVEDEMVARGWSLPDLAFGPEILREIADILEKENQ